MNRLTLELALRYVLGRKRSMSMSLLGITFGIAFFVVTQAQTSGFEVFFIRTILGTNGAIRVSDKFQDMDGTIRTIDKEGKLLFTLESREGSRYIEGTDSPNNLRRAQRKIPNRKLDKSLRFHELNFDKRNGHPLRYS